MPKAMKIEGQTFGRLRVVVRDGSMPRGTSRWLCECECGTRLHVDGNSLKSGNTASCGCWQREGARSRKTNLTHGRSHSPEHNTWLDMRRRCTDPTRRSYPDYGGRGIKVCDRWADFALFLADVGSRPSPHHSIERIDTNGHYEPGNVRWATAREQSLNTRRNLIVTAFGCTAPLGAFLPTDRFTPAQYKRAWKRLRVGDTAEQAILAATEGGAPCLPC